MYRNPDEVPVSFSDDESDSVDSLGVCSGQPPAKQLHLESHRDISSYIALPSVNKTGDKKYQLIVDHFVPDASYIQVSQRCQQWT